MKAKSLLAAVALACAALGGTASAADISHSDQALALVDGTAGFSAAFAAGNFNNTFADHYTFSIPGPQASLVDALVGSIAHSATVGLEITAFDLYTSGGTQVGTGAMQQSGMIDLWTIGIGAGLSPGDYYVQVSGRLVSAESGSYGGNLNLTPVPEPGMYAMTLAGLGVVSLSLVRRRRRT